MNLRLAAVSLLALVPCTGCVRMRVADFVNERLGNDPGFRATAEAAQAAERVYNQVADMPISELRARNEQLTRDIGNARDAFRRSLSYTINLGKSSLPTDGVSLTDRGTEQGGRFPVRGLSVCLVVSVTDDFVTPLRLETSRGKELITFESAMVPNVSKDFRPILLGDRVNFKFEDILVQLRRDLDQPTGTTATVGATPGKTHCGGCGASLADPAARFCSACGEPQTPLPGERVFCETCGVKLTPGGKFCESCGTAVEPPR